MRVLLLVLFFIGVILTIIGYYQNKIFLPRQKIIYKFVDKNIEEAIYENQNVGEIFKPMFETGLYSEI